MKQIVLILLGCSAGPVLASEPAALRFPHVLLDEKPPQNPWIKIVGDLNADGRPDIILAPMQLKSGMHHIAWYKAPPDATAGNSKQHIIKEPVETVSHALAVADSDGDGKLDVAAARMHQEKHPQEVDVYLNTGGGLQWKRQVIATTGSYDIVAADLNGDGRTDLLGANHGGSYQPVELWRNGGR